jgi:transposase
MAKLTSIPANQTLSSSAQLYAVGIDIGSEKCSFSVLSSDKSVIINPQEMTNDNTGYDLLISKLGSLALPANCFVIGLEATGRYWENLYHRLQNQGYQVLLLHPAQRNSLRNVEGYGPKPTGWMLAPSRG